MFKMINTTLHVNSGPFTGSYSIEHKSFVFPGGEVHVRYDLDSLTNGVSQDEDFYYAVINARIRNSNDLMELILASRALKETFYIQNMHCNLFYLPYARQDRQCVIGEPLSVKVFFDVIKAANFDSIDLFDPHSDVSNALLDCGNTHEVQDIISLFKHLPLYVNGKETALVSPDAGANKKVFKVAQRLGVDKIVRCDKMRNVSTGEIIETVVYEDEIDYPCFIIDDICDGGRTFIEIAKALRAKGCPEVYLYVTHGIFSKGLHVFDGLIDRIYTTDSFFNPDEVACGAHMEHPFSLKSNHENDIIVNCLHLDERF